ncbi:hypothetical protein D9619_013652 [Psilocybe cf. subviscida]|uniref:Uncharacterized protein n=1 Tax=Psilocybe cf. subviscida TaxID=2480587 RepID=A0A8H5BR72_9AGAR|nr:hypothetical protein D9619_013652 [Psilocybe cf. subviscida]
MDVPMLYLRADHTPISDKAHSFSDFSKTVQRMMYIGIGSTAVIDTINSVVLCHLLFKASPQNHERLKSRGVVRFLILFFLGTGVLTAFNSKASLRQRMQATLELKISSTLIFGDNADEVSPVTEGPTPAAES